MALQNPFARFVRELKVEAPVVNWSDVSLPALERLRIHADVGPEQPRTILEWVSAHPKLRTMSGRSRTGSVDGTAFTPSGPSGRLVS